MLSWKAAKVLKGAGRRRGSCSAWRAEMVSAILAALFAGKEEQLAAVLRTGALSPVPFLGAQRAAVWH